MSNQLLKYFFLVFTMLFFHLFASAGSELDHYFGRSYNFSMGYTAFDLPLKMSIRADQGNGQVIEVLIRENKFRINFSQRNVYINIREDWRNFDQYFEIDSAGNEKSNPDLSFDIDLLNTKRSREFLISFGNIIFSDNAKERILQLVFDPSFGRPINLSEFSNLKTLLVDCRKFEMEGSQTKNSHSILYMEYKGDPFLLDEIAKIKGLENLIIYEPTARYYRYEPYFMDGPKKELFELPSLKSITIEGAPYLPIPGNEWQKIESFYTAGIFYPELVNLALVFKHFGKDTSYSNWYEYLEYANHSIPFSIPDNGTFQTFYKNGKPLCKGNYQDGLPHGEWNFWYEDGKLCERRIYEKGKREGNWFFLLPSNDYHQRIDTILTLDYKNDTLLHRQDRYLDEGMQSDGCYYDDDEYYTIRVFCVVDNKIEYNQGHKMTINKEMRCYVLESENPRLIIPAGFKEIWNYSNEAWTYTFEDHCNNKKQLTSTFLKGRKGENAYYTCSYSLREADDGKVYKDEHIVDLQNCFVRSSYYEAENDTSQFKLSGTPREYFERLPCEK